MFILKDYTLTIRTTFCSIMIDRGYTQVVRFNPTCSQCDASPRFRQTHSPKKRNKLEWGCPNGTKYPPRQPIPNRAILPNRARLQTDGQTDGRTDGRTGWFQYTPPNFVAGGIMKMTLTPHPQGSDSFCIPVTIFDVSLKQTSNDRIPGTLALCSPWNNKHVNGCQRLDKFK